MEKWIRKSVRRVSERDGFNELIQKRFPVGTAPKEIREWCVEAQNELERQLEAHRQKEALRTGITVSEGFRYDVIKKYLPAVAAMPSIDDRTRDMHRWIDEFGDRDPLKIESYEIRAVAQRWLKVGPKRKRQLVNDVGVYVDVAEPLGASTVNHRLRALSNFYTVLKYTNPVREVPESDESHGIPRAIDYGATIPAILAAMADRGRGKRGEKREKESRGKVCARVMAWTGCEYTELTRVSLEDIMFDKRVLVVPPRRKGTGAPGRFVPLSDEAIAALRDFVRLELYTNGKKRMPDSKVILRAWQRACIQVVGRPLRLKDLRHSFVTRIVDVTRDLKQAQLLAGHNDSRTTQRYAMSALLPMLTAAVDAAFERKSDDQSNDVLGKAPRGHRGTAAKLPRNRQRAGAAHQKARGD